MKAGTNTYLRPMPLFRSTRSSEGYLETKAFRAEELLIFRLVGDAYSQGRISHCHMLGWVTSLYSKCQILWRVDRIDVFSLLTLRAEHAARATIIYKCRRTELKGVTKTPYLLTLTRDYFELTIARTYCAETLRQYVALL